MKLINSNTLEIKKSKFIGLYFEIDDISEIDEILKDVKNKYKNARHIPYAYKFGSIAKKSDDKEPSNTAGTPIYNVIERNNLDHALILVVRIFGGIKLGSGPLLRAYSKCANGLISHK